MSDFVSNRPVVREFNKQGQPLLRRFDRYLVERTEDGGWEPTQPTDRFVSAEELGSKFGLWQDKEISEGHLWWKETSRPKDGVIDKDEVVTMADVMSTPHDTLLGYSATSPAHANYETLLATDTTLELTTDGGTLHTDWVSQSRHVEVAGYGVVYNHYLGH